MPGLPRPTMSFIYKEKKGSAKKEEPTGIEIIRRACV
jgi:hypothetical protein